MKTLRKLKRSSVESFRALIQRIEGITAGRQRAKSSHRRAFSSGDVLKTLACETLELRSLLSALTVSIAPETISENGGSATGTVTRTGMSNAQPLTVILTSSDTSEVTVPGTVVIAAGQDSATFAITAVDDTLLDGTQVATITASSVGNGDGSLDLSYGTNGYAALPNYRMDISPSILHIAVQSDGKSVIAGRHPTLENAWNVIRLTTSGTLDSTFGSGGTVTSTFGSSVFPQGITVGPDGQIYVVGRGLGASNHLVARYSSSGVQNLTINPSNALFGHDIVADQSGNGKFYVGGAVSDDFAVLRYNGNGTLDSTWGTAGLAKYTLASTSETGWAMTQQPDGKILVAGNAAGGDFGIVRFNTNGSLDTTFSTDGFESVNFGGTDSASSIALAPDGKILLAGSTSAGTGDWAVARLTASGSLDSSFSNDGKDTLDWGSLTDSARTVAVQQDGRFVVGGGAFISGFGTEMAVARYNVDGTLDTTFDSDGRKIMPSQPTVFEETRTVAVQADGNLLVLGGYASTYVMFRLTTASPVTPGSATISVTDSETLTVTASLLTISENNGQSTGTVTRSNTDTGSALTVSLASSDTTAATVPNTVTIAAGQSSATFTITGVDDAVIDGSQSVTITASAASYGSGSVALTVTDDDTPRLTLLVTTSSPTAPAFSEGAGANAATLTITRSGSTADAVTVNLSSNDSTEAVVQATAVIPAGVSSVSVPIDAVDDSIIDGARTVLFTGTASGHVTGSTSAIVEDDDYAGITITPISGLVTTEGGGTATFSVVLTSQPLVNISISFRTSDNTEGTISASSLLFTTADWNVPKTMTVTGVNDSIVDGDVNYTIVTSSIFSNDPNFNGINPPDISVRNLDDDTAALSLTLSGTVLSESGSPGTHTGTVTRNTPLDNDLIVAITSSDASEATVPVTVTIPGGQASASFTISVADDVLVDGSQSVTVTTTASGHSSAQQSLTVQDDDLAGFSVSGTSLTVSETGTTETFDVVLNAAPLTDVVFAVSTSDSSETALSATTLTFSTSNWNVPQTVTVTGVDDLVDDNNQTSTITISVVDASSNDAFDVLADKTVAVSTLDDDTAGTTITPNTGLLVMEGGATDSVSLVLNTEPVADVIIDIVNPAPDQTTFSTYRLTFTPQNWSTPQSILITAIDDSLAEVSYGIGVLPQPAISSDSKYNGLISQGANGSVLDNDARTITVSLASSSISEAGGSTTATISRNDFDRSQPLTVTLASSDTTEASVPATVTIPAGQAAATVTVNAVDDIVVDGTQSVTISATATSYVSGSAALSVTDNDIPNVPPVITSLTNTSQTLSRRNPGEAITINGAFTDLNPADVHSASINWGDGTTTTGSITEANGSGTISGSKSYSQPGVYIVTVTLNDGNGGTASRSTVVAVTGAKLANGVVIVVGTNLADAVAVTKNGKNLRVQAGFLSGSGRVDYALTAVTRVEIWLNAGNDSASIGSGITQAVAVIGGAGTDTVTGSGVLLDSTVAEGRVSNQTIPLSIPRLPSSSIDSVFGSLIDRNRFHWLWSL